MHTCKYFLPFYWLSVNSVDCFLYYGEAANFEILLFLFLLLLPVLLRFDPKNVLLIFECTSYYLRKICFYSLALFAELY